MPKYSEDAILSAIKDVESGTSQRKAAEYWGIPRSTLNNRLKGVVTRNAANEHRQRLSKQQEFYLVQWILSQRALGFPPTRNQVTGFAGRVIRASGDDQPLGKGWVEGFLRRNPEAKGPEEKLGDE